MIRYRRDPTWRGRPDSGVVVAGSPLRLFRVSPGGAHVLELAERGEQPPTDVVARMLDRFVDAGALHPEPDAGPYTAADVTVVIPCFGEVPAPVEGLATLVVDDGSPTPLTAPPGAHLLRLPVNRGPGAARNAGLAEVRTPLVAFLDADVTVGAGWLEPLLRHFTDPRVALVAPRVASEPGTGAIARYEERHSPLDMGAEPARIAPGTRVSYVPAAALVCRVDALRDIDGFDEAMRSGEDVDLVWRLVAAQHRCRYEPASVVHHRPRATWPELLRRRTTYGRSAAPLARRHPGALAPVRMSPWSAGVWLLVALRRPWWALAVAAGTTVALVRKLRDVPPAESVRLTVLGHLAAGRQLARAVTRVWWPVAVVAAVASRRARVGVAAAAFAPAAADALLARSTAPLRELPAVLADDAAYGLGVWEGVCREREPGPLLPDLTRWPRRGDG